MLRSALRLILLFAMCAAVLSGCDLAPGPVRTPLSLVTPTAEPAASPSAQASLPPACKADTMQGIAGWQGATGALAGGLFLMNNGAEPCTLVERPGIHVVGPDGSMLPVTDVEATGDATPSSTPVIVLPGSRVYANFVWRNWCGQSKGPYSLAVALPGDGGQLNVPVLDPQGTPVTDTPRCDTNQEASTIAVGQFVVPH